MEDECVVCGRIYFMAIIGQQYDKGIVVCTLHCTASCLQLREVQSLCNSLSHFFIFNLRKACMAPQKVEKVKLETMAACDF